MDEYIQYPLQFKPLTRDTIQKNLDSVDKETAELHHRFNSGKMFRRDYREELDRLNMKRRLFKALMPKIGD